VPYKQTLFLLLSLFLFTACSPQAVLDKPASGVLPVADSAQLPDVIKTLISQSDHQFLNNDFAGALATLERAVRINPRYAEVWSRMAQVYLKQGKIEQARQHAKRSNSVIKNNDSLRKFNNEIITSDSIEDSSVIQKEQAH